MFDIGYSELLLIVIVAVVVIGPKDLPLALRTAGRWIGKMRKISGHFRSGLDAMIREAEMEEMEAKWREQNERIMREHPNGGPVEAEQTGAYPAVPPVAAASAEARIGDGPAIPENLLPDAQPAPPAPPHHAPPTHPEGTA
ncbi:MAG: hypothetical protein RLZZ08_934 [Pseudomonadota bacterium]|jgi:sec-independent protein translocase protein TatB